MRQHLLEFFTRLREAGLRISVGESLDAMQAAAAAGFERPLLREALSAALVKDEALRPVFDREFARFFRTGHAGRASPRRADSWQGMAGGHGRGEAAGGLKPPPAPDTTQGPRSEKQRVRETSANAGSLEEKQLPTEQERNSGHEQAAQPAEQRRLAAMRDAAIAPFTIYSDLDYEQALAALGPLRRRFRIRLGRRLRAARHGRVDFRRTLRAAIQHGGALIDLRSRARRPRHLDLLLLGDVSGSVRYASILMLGLMAGANDLFRRVTSFVFIDRLAEAGFENGYLTITPTLDLYARSDFGRVLAQLMAQRRRLLTPATVVVILGDARNNRRPPRADLLRQMRRLARAVIWLNPEDPARWGSGDSAVEVYARAVDRMVQCGNLRELEAALGKVA